jgi:hypothetical protein
MQRARTAVLAAAAAVGGLLLAGIPATVAAASTAPDAGIKLVKVSTDPYSGDGAQHATEAEPDTTAWGKTIVSVFQVGRFEDGGATNTGWATSTDGGATWKHGYLPGITVAAGGTYARVSDPVVTYDAKDKQWLASGLVLNAQTSGVGVVVNRSKNGTTWSKPILVVGNDGNDYDKDWITCDNSSTSTNEGHCYVEVDIDSAGDEVVMVTSTDGGKTWGAKEQPQGGAFGLGGQPLVQPDGTVIVPFTEDFDAIASFNSTNGGKSWTSVTVVSQTTDHEVPGMREEPLPSATMDAAGKVYVVWDDCRFRAGCSANDIVMSTSTDGLTWSSVVRIPIDGVKSGRDHFDPGIGVSPDASGSHAQMGLYYYFYPKADCSVSQCRLDVGFVSSANDGTTWSKAETLTKPMSLSWLAQAGGAMVGDYISCDVIGSTAVSVFAVGKAPKGSVKNQAMYSAGPLPITGGKRRTPSLG